MNEIIFFIFAFAFGIAVYVAIDYFFFGGLLFGTYMLRSSDMEYDTAKAAAAAANHSEWIWEPTAFTKR